MIKKIYNLRYKILCVALAIALVILCSLFLVAIFTPDTPKQLTEQQQSCDHEWYELDYHLNDYGRAAYGLYCPKCKLEQEVETEEWAKMKIDMEYEKENNND